MVAVVVISAFGLRGAVEEFLSALCASGRNVLDEDARASDLREALVELENQWMETVATEHESETAGRQVWWALDDDDIDPLWAAFKPILAAHSVRDLSPGSIPIDRVAWSIDCHWYVSEH